MQRRNASKSSHLEYPNNDFEAPDRNFVDVAAEPTGDSTAPPATAYVAHNPAPTPFAHYPAPARFAPNPEGANAPAFVAETDETASAFPSNDCASTFASNHEEIAPADCEASFADQTTIHPARTRGYSTEFGAPGIRHNHEAVLAKYRMRQ